MLTRAAATQSVGELGLTIHFISDVQAAIQACSDLSRCSKVAIDIEGIDLCRDGTACLLQAAKEDKTTYIFDLCALGRAAFDRGGLRNFLENTTTEKIIFDGRADADALYHQFNVDLSKGRFCDVQYLYCMACGDVGDRFLKGLGKALGSAYWLSGTEKMEMERVKSAGKRLFAPEVGGTYEVWRRRPISQELLVYAAVDVVHLHEMALRWRHAASDVNIVASRRMKRACTSHRAAKGKHQAFRDFH